MWSILWIIVQDMWQPNLYFVVYTVMLMYGFDINRLNLAYYQRQAQNQWYHNGFQSTETMKWCVFPEILAISVIFLIIQLQQLYYPLKDKLSTFKPLSSSSMCSLHTVVLHFSLVKCWMFSCAALASSACSSSGFAEWKICMRNEYGCGCWSGDRAGCPPTVGLVVIHFQAPPNGEVFLNK